MRFDLITIFPEMFDAVLDFGITSRALDSKLVEVNTFNPRDFTVDAHRNVDDRPYGGGPGMVMRPEPLTAAVDAARQSQTDAGLAPTRVIYLSPQGAPLDHKRVIALAGEPGLTLIAGRYEGIDERVIEATVDEEISIGDYVLAGGELAAMVVMEAVIRQLPGALGNAASAQIDSFVDGLLDCPHYTRPESFDGRQVPEVLLSGDHEAIARWRADRSLERTQKRRPDLLEGRPRSPNPAKNRS